MARSVNKIECIGLPIMNIVHLDSVALDSDTFLLLKIHRVQYLILHVASCQRISNLKHSIRQGTLTVVDVGYDTKVSSLLHSKSIIRAKIIQIFLILFKPYHPSNV